MHPTNVIIGDTAYSVVTEDLGDECDGEFCAKQGTIRLQSATHWAYLKYLLCHEIVHGLLEHAGVLEGEGQETFTEEQVACVIGRALPKLLKDNPELVKYLTE